LSRGDVILTVFPFTDLSSSKVRPATIVGRPEGDDLVLAFLSSQTSVGHTRSSYLLHPSDADFGRTGLRRPSLVRLNKLATLHRVLVQRRLGHIGPRADAAIAQRLRYVFEL
jgi:mRNA interferase MazF